MKSNKNNKPSIKLGSKPTVVAKNATSQKSIEQLVVGEYLSVTLGISPFSELFRIILDDDWYGETYSMDLDRESLKGLADFILQYLENN